MDLLKKHYEKVLLGVVLLGLVAATASLPFIKAAQEEAINNIISAVTKPRVQLLTNLDLTAQSKVVEREAAPFAVDFGPPNKLFNPMPWERTADNRMIKKDDTHIGPRAVIVTKVSPLYLTVSLDSVMVSDTGARYVFGVTKEAAPTPDKRHHHQFYCSVGTKNDTFALVSVQGPPESPTNLVLQLSDTDEQVNLSKEKPYRRIDGYMADLKYDPEHKVWSDRRKDSMLSFNGEDYKIVAISEDEVVLSGENRKKWTIKYNPPSNNAASNNVVPNNSPPP